MYSIVFFLNILNIYVGVGVYTRINIYALPYVIIILDLGWEGWDWSGCGQVELHM